MKCIYSVIVIEQEIINFTSKACLSSLAYGSDPSLLHVYLILLIN